MKINASAKFVRVTPSKVRPLARLLRGKSLKEALVAAGFNNQKGAFFIAKLLKSMAANLAGNELSGNDFYIEKIAIEQGPTSKRFWPRSRGMARPITKRTSHIRIVLSDLKETGKE
ncbi:MAG: 50S ribosomal protein L22 [Kiritimatiellia bacterium]|nr:50S ribosomal protein L22 [Kiritimatiellia bacterium]